MKFSEYIKQNSTNESNKKQSLKFSEWVNQYVTEQAQQAALAKAQNDYAYATTPIIPTADPTLRKLKGQNANTLQFNPIAPEGAPVDPDSGVRLVSREVYDAAMAERERIMAEPERRKREKAAAQHAEFLAKVEAEGGEKHDWRNPNGKQGENEEKSESAVSEYLESHKITDPVEEYAKFKNETSNSSFLDLFKTDEYKAKEAYKAKKLAEEDEQRTEYNKTYRAALNEKRAEMGLSSMSPELFAEYEKVMSENEILSSDNEYVKNQKRDNVKAFNIMLSAISQSNFSAASEIGAKTTADKLEGNGLKTIHNIINGVETSDSANRVYSMLTENEKAVWNYYIGVGKTEAALDYIRVMNPTLEARLAQTVSKEYDEQGFWGGVKEMGASLSGGFAKGGLDMMRAFGGVGDALGIAEMNSMQARMFEPTYAERLADYVLADSGGADGKVFNMILSALNSVAYQAPSMAFTAMGGGMAGYVMQGIGANTTEGIRNNTNSMANVIYGVYEGAMEYAVDRMLGGASAKLAGKGVGLLTKALLNHIDELVSNKAIRTLLSKGVIHLSTAGSEWLEEFIQTLAEPAARAVIYGEEMDYSLDTLKNALEAAMVGGIAGFIMGFGTTKSTYRQYQSETFGNSLISTGKLDTLVRFAEDFGATDSTVYDSVKEAVENKNDPDPMEVAQLYSQTMQKYNTFDEVDIARFVKNTANKNSVDDIAGILFNGNTEAAQKFVDKYSKLEIPSGENVNTEMPSVILGTAENYDSIQNIDEGQSQGYNDVAQDNQGGVENATHQQRRVGESSFKHTGADPETESQGQRTRPEDEGTFRQRNSGSVSGRTRRIVIPIKNTLFAYTPKETDGSQASLAVEKLNKVGINAVYCEGNTESNADGVTTLHTEAVTAPDGTIYVSDSSSLSSIQIAAHEAVHFHQKNNTAEYTEFESTVSENVLWGSDTYCLVAKKIFNGHHRAKYEKKAERVLTEDEVNYIIKSPKYRKSFLIEFTAYVNEAISANSTETIELFSKVFSDWDAVVEASRRFNEAIGLDFSGADADTTTAPSEDADTDTQSDGAAGVRMMDLPAISVKVQSFVKSVGKALGRNVEFVNMEKFLKEHDINTEKLKIYPEGAIDGKGNIYLWYNAEKPVQFLFKHELTHFGERSKYYETFVKVVRESKVYLEWLKKTTKMEGASREVMEAELMEKHREAQSSLTSLGYDGAMAEIIADFVGEKCFGESLEDMNKLVASVKDVKERNAVVRFLHDFFLWLKNKCVSSGLLKKELSVIEQNFARMIADADNTKTPDTKDGGLKYSFEGYAEDGKGKYKSNFPKGTPKAAKADVILRYIQNVWSKKPIRLKIEENGQTRYIEAQFDPTYDESGNVVTDASKLMGGNRHGTSAEQRVTLDLADDYYQIASESRYNYSKDETGKDNPAHKDVVKWHYFVNDIYFTEYGSDEYVPYRVSINVKERADGNFVYSFSAEKQERLDTQRTLHAVVNNAESVANDQPSNNKVPQKPPVVKNNSMQESENYSSEKNDLKFSVPTATESKADADNTKTPDTKDGGLKYSVGNDSIVPNMSEADRAKILRAKQVNLVNVENSDLNNEFDFADLENNIKSKVEKSLLKKFQELGLLKKYKSVAISDVEFDFTGKGVRKSLNSQETAYGGSKADFTKAVIHLQELLDNSVLIETHTDKGKGTDRENQRLKQVYVLLSAMQEGNAVIPVQFEVKQYIDENNRLYLAVALTKIETGVVGNTASDKQMRTFLIPISNISIPELFAKINPKDGKFLKYIPDEFLNASQIEAKKQALSEDETKYGLKFSVATESDTETDTQSDGAAGVRMMDLPAISVKVQSFVKSVGKALGRNVEFVNMEKFLKEHDINTEKLKIYPEGAIDGKGNIYLWYNAEKPVQFLFKHELTHFGERSKYYKQFVEVVRSSKVYLEWLKKTTKMEGASREVMEAELMEKHREAQSGLTSLGYDGAMAEIIADFVGEKCFGESLEDMNKLVASVKDVKERNAVVRFLHDFFLWLKNKCVSSGLLKKELSVIEQNFARMIADADNTKTPTEKGRGLKYSASDKNVIDLSNDNELSKAVEGLHGSARYTAIQNYILESLSEQPVMLSDGKQAVVDKRDALHMANKSGQEKTAHISAIKRVVETASLIAEENSQKNGKFDYFYYYEAIVKYDGDTYPIYLNVGRARNDGVYHLYDITKKLRDTAHRVNDVGRPVGNALKNGISNNNIPNSGENVNNNSQEDKLKFSVATESDTDIENTDFTAEFNGLMQSFQNGEISQDEYMRRVSELYQQSIDENGQVLQGEVVEKYTESQYNNFGWVRANDVLTAAEYNTLLSRYADFEHNKDEYPTTRFGEAVIHSSECPDVIMYVKGSIESPQITKVVRILADEANVKELILKNERARYSQPFKAVEAYFGQWILDIDYKRDYASFRDYQAEQEGRGGKSGNTSGRAEQNREGSFTEGEGANSGNGGVNSLKFSIATAERTDTSTDFPTQQKELFEKLQSGEITQQEYMDGINSLWERAQEEYGTIPDGETVTEKNKPYPTPKSVKEGTKVRQHVRTILESGMATEGQEGILTEQILSGKLSYTPTSDEKRIKSAESNIQKLGYQVALDNWKRKNADIFTSDKNHVAEGEALLVLAFEHKNEADIVNLTAELAELGTRTAQNLQAMKLLKRMGGIAQLVYVQRCVAKINQDLSKRFKRRQEKRGIPVPQVKLNETLAQQLAESKTTAEYEITYEAIMQDVAAQVPPTFLDKFNAWRYMAMLLNVTTHVRNFLGNAIFLPAIRIKNVLGKVMELTQDKSKRTKSVVVKKEYKDFARQDFDEVKDIIAGGGKYNPSDSIEQYRRIFKTKWLEAARKFNFDLLEKEDMIFLRAHYTHALGGYLQAQGASLDNVSPEQMAKARAYAMQEALKATYRDASKMANVLSQLSHSSKAANVLIEGTMPFKKTPINIVKRGIEYSPVGLISTVGKGIDMLRGGEVTADQFIDGLAANLTGTGVFLLGMLLAGLGVAKGGFDDEEKWFRKLNGEQEYSIEIAGRSYTISWASPVCIPFFIGVAAMEYKADEDGDLLSCAADLALAGFEPLLELSCLSGINDLIEGVKYATSGASIPELVGNAAGSYLSQLLPTIGGKVANLFDDTRRTTYIDKTSDMPEIAQEALDKIASKTPFASQSRAEYIDAWGETQYTGNFVQRFFQQFVSPGYASTVNVDDVSEELMRLYRQTDVSGIFPSTPQKYFKIRGERRDLSQEEYFEYATFKGQTQADLVDEAIHSEEYAALTDEQKAEVIKDIYSYAGALAKCQLDYTYEEVAAMEGEDTRGNLILTEEKYNRLNDKARQLLIDEYFMEGSSNVKAYKVAKNGRSVVEYFCKKVKDN